MQTLKKLLKGHKTAVFLDLEGTQFSHEVIALGAIKCKLDENANIIEEEKNGLLVYVFAQNPIGRIIKSLTHIDEDLIAQNGISFNDALLKLKEYVGDDFDHSSYIVFGSNDAKMLIESAKFSQPKDIEICHKILNNTFDFLAFISQYIRDENNNPYSLINYLKFFNAQPVGESHNPLNDAIDLKNLYINFLNQKNIVKQQYEKLLYQSKIFPQPIKQILNKLEKNETVTKQDFECFISDYLV